MQNDFEPVLHQTSCLVKIAGNVLFVEDFDRIKGGLYIGK